MGHDHQHGHVHAGGGVRAAFFLNLSFTILEIVGGLLTNSVAIISDAVHDLGDTISLGLAWRFQVLGRRGSTPTFTFGYRRFNTLGALITSVVLVAGSVYALTQAIPRLWSPEPVHVGGMLGLAVLGVLVNGAAVWRLRSKGGGSLNEEVVSLHLLEDVLGWVAVLVGATVMYFVDAPWIDPLLSIAIALYVLSNVWHSIRRASMIVLQAKPEGVEPDELIAAAEAEAGPGKVTHLHVWTLDGEYHLASLDVSVDERATVASLEGLRTAIRERLHARGIEHVTVEFRADAPASAKTSPCIQIDEAAASINGHAGHNHAH